MQELRENILNGRSRHCLGCDYALFAVWHTAKPYLGEIKKSLQERFEIVYEAEVVWSEKYYLENAQRFYETPINPKKTNILKKLGSKRFTTFVIRDINPQYAYAVSVSGKIESSNLNVVSAKYSFRALVEEHTGIKYSVHSTNNINEFLYQAPLLFGLEIFNKILGGETFGKEIVKKDLEGAGGWGSYQELFSILNVTTEYLVQRGFERLPISNDEKDLDFLTRNYQRLASAIGGNQLRSQPYKATVLIDGHDIALDLRFVGDKYYNDVWSDRMLGRRVLRNGLYVPEKSDYFFSLLYHCKVQKPDVKPKYLPLLETLAKGLKIDWYKTSLLRDNDEIGKLLRGYFISEGYVFEKPVDKRVFNNKHVTKYLPKPMVNSNRQYFKQRTKKTIIKTLKITLPVSVFNWLKKINESTK